MTPKIYLTCIATHSGSGIVHDSTPGGDVIGYALAEDGYCLAQHLSSNINWSKHDMGLSSNWKHENYEKHYPDGFELEWINEEDLDSHDGWNKAIELNRILYEKENNIKNKE